MPSFHYVDNELYAEDVALTEIAREHGTPTYVYSKTDIENAYTAFDEAFSDHPHLVCYSVKANSNIARLNIQLNRNFTCKLDVCPRSCKA